LILKIFYVVIKLFTGLYVAYILQWIFVVLTYISDFILLYTLLEHFMMPFLKKIINCLLMQFKLFTIWSEAMWLGSRGVLVQRIISRFCRDIFLTPNFLFLYLPQVKRWHRICSLRKICSNYLAKNWHCTSNFLLYFYFHLQGMHIIGIGIYLHSINLYKRCGNSHRNYNKIRKSYKEHRNSHHK
jgi:hypothetical protein